MSESGRFAYITGGASGIGKAVATMLVKKGCSVFIADRNVDGAASVVQELNASQTAPLAFSTAVETTDWDSQVKAFSQAVTQFGRIDYVFPIAGIGERVWLRNDPTKTSGYDKPDLTVLDVDLYGVLYTVSLAVQQFRRQEVGSNGFRGKICYTASVTGIYCVPTIPVYTAAKHAMTGFTRSYGAWLSTEKITMNAVHPSVVRTGIGAPAFYDLLESKGLLTPMDGVLAAFEHMLDSDVSGQCFECGPQGGYTPRKPPELLDEKSGEVLAVLESRTKGLHLPK